MLLEIFSVQYSSLACVSTVSLKREILCQFIHFYLYLPIFLVKLRCCSLTNFIVLKITEVSS